MESVHTSTRRRGVFVKALMWVVGTKSAVLAVRVGFVCILGLLGVLAGILFVPLPNGPSDLISIWVIVGLSAVGLLIVVRVGVPIGLWVAKKTETPH